MNITINHTALGRVAHIETPAAIFYIHLDDHLPTAQSLRRYAKTLRGNNRPNAEIIYAAAERYEQGYNAPVFH